MDVTDLRDICRMLKIKEIVPVEQLRECCACIDEHLADRGTYGSSVSDRTHFAYAIVAGAHFYATSQSEVRTLDSPCGKGKHLDCDGPPPKVVSIDQDGNFSITKPLQQAWLKTFPTLRHLRMHVHPIALKWIERSVHHNGLGPRPLSARFAHPVHRRDRQPSMAGCVPSLPGSRWWSSDPPTISAVANMSSFWTSAPPTTAMMRYPTPTSSMRP